MLIALYTFPDYAYDIDVVIVCKWYILVCYLAQFSHVETCHMPQSNRLSQQTTAEVLHRKVEYSLQ